MIRSTISAPGSSAAYARAATGPEYMYPAWGTMSAFGQPASEAFGAEAARALLKWSRTTARKDCASSG